MTTLYRLFDANDRLLYIGIAERWTGRLAQHHADKTWFGDVARLTIEHHPDHTAALEAEAAAIRSERPEHNVMHNGQRSTSEQAPQPSAVMWVHVPRDRDHGTYQGRLDSWDEDHYLVTWFSWYDGCETHSEIVSVDDIRGWRLYRTHAAWLEAGDRVMRESDRLAAK